MSFAQYSDTISVGDTVMIYEGPRSVKPLTVASGAVFQNKYGHFRHDDMVRLENLASLRFSVRRRCLVVTCMSLLFDKGNGSPCKASCVSAV